MPLGFERVGFGSVGIVEAAGFLAAISVTEFDVVEGTPLILAVACTVSVAAFAFCVLTSFESISVETAASPFCSAFPFSAFSCSAFSCSAFAAS